MKIETRTLPALSFALAFFCAFPELGATELRSEPVAILSGGDVPESERTMLRDQVQKVVDQQLVALGQCVTKRPEGPPIHGLLTLLFGFTSTGQPEAPALVSSTLRDGPTEQCMLKAASGWTLPKPVHLKSVAICPFIVNPGIDEPAPAPSSTTTPPDGGAAPPHPAVRASMDKEIIRRIIRLHVDEVRTCYERELVHNANLIGRVLIQFVINGEGTVAKSLVYSSTMGNPTVEECIADTTRKWKFPKPMGHGIVVVTYPFVLKTLE